MLIKIVVLSCANQKEDHQTTTERVFNDLYKFTVVV